MAGIISTSEFHIINIGISSEKKKNIGRSLLDVMKMELKVTYCCTACCTKISILFSDLEQAMN